MIKYDIKNKIHKNELIIINTQYYNNTQFL